MKKYFAKTFVAMIITGSLSQVAFATPTDLTLDDSISLAFKNNQTLQIAEINLDKARWGIDQATGSKGFNVSFNHMDERSNQNPYPSLADPMFVVPIYNMHTDQLSVSLPLYTGGKLEGAIDQAKLNYQVAELTVDATKEQLKLSATAAYYSVLQAKNLLEVAKQQTQDFADHLKNVQTQFDAGTVARIDVLQSKVQVANAQDVDYKAQNTYDLAVANLNNVIGLPLKTEVNAKDIFSYQNYSQTLDECTEYGLTHRPEMIQTQRNVDIAKDQIKIAKSGYLPSVAVSAANDWLSQNFPGLQNRNWTIGLNASIDIFDSGMTKAQVKQADDAVAAAIKQEQLVSDNISLQIQQAYLSMKEAEKRIDTSNAAVQEAIENVRMANISYGAGVSTNLDVVDAELNYIQARTNNVQALYDYNTSRAQLDEAMGLPVK